MREEHHKAKTCELPGPRRAPRAHWASDAVGPDVEPIGPVEGGREARGRQTTIPLSSCVLIYVMCALTCFCAYMRSCMCSKVRSFFLLALFGSAGTGLIGTNLAGDGPTLKQDRRGCLGRLRATDADSTIALEPLTVQLRD